MPSGVEGLRTLLAEIDAWAARRGAPLHLVIMGGGALLLGHGGGRATKDLDVVVHGASEVQRLGLDVLEAEFGRRTGREPWLELVSAGLPRLPGGWASRAVPIPGEWSSLSLRRLSVADQVAAKLKAWRPHDRRDIEYLLTLHPEARAELEALSTEHFWLAEDIWEEQMRPRRDLILRWMDGEVDSLR